MPKYPTIADGTAFTAASLNERFDFVAGEVNAVTAESLRLQGIGPNSVASLVGSLNDDSEYTTETGAGSVLTLTNPTGSPPLTSAGTLVWTGIPATTAVGYELEVRGGAELSLTRTDSDGVNCLIVLANVEVRQFYVPDMYIIQTPSGHHGINLNEYEYAASVAIELEDALGTTGVVHRTQRVTSPRITIGWIGNDEVDDPPTDTDGNGVYFGRVAMGPLRDLPGPAVGASPPVTPSPKQWDTKTFQDVPIRTVITQADLTTLGLTGVKYVRMVFASPTAHRFRVQRGNLTAIPTVAELT